MSDSDYYQQEGGYVPLEHPVPTDTKYDSITQARKECVSELEYRLYGQPLTELPMSRDDQTP